MAPLLFNLHLLFPSLELEAYTLQNDLRADLVSVSCSKDRQTQKGKAKYTAGWGGNSDQLTLANVGCVLMLLQVLF